MENNNMKTFEYYKYYQINGCTILSKELRELGEKGWEMCGCEEINDCREYYFKREIIDKIEGQFKQIKCFAQGKDFCFSDFDNKEEILSLNINNIMFISNLEEFVLPLSGAKTGKKYFYVQLIHGMKLYCNEKEFNNILK